MNVYFKINMYKQNLIHQSTRMFTIEINPEEQSVTLSFVSDHFTLKFTPEDSQHILDVNLGESGNFDTSPGNGECSMTWTPEQFFFNVARYGDGSGGYLYVTIKNTPEIMQSFRECIDKWVDYAKLID